MGLCLLSEIFWGMIGVGVDIVALGSAGSAEDHLLGGRRLGACYR